MRKHVRKLCKILCYSLKRFLLASLFLSFFACEPASMPRSSISLMLVGCKAGLVAKAEDRESEVPSEDRGDIATSL